MGFASECRLAGYRISLVSNGQQVAAVVGVDLVNRKAGRLSRKEV